MALSVASLHIHPIKSLGGFEVNDAHITDRGFEHDRRWMLVDANGCFISQREVAAMACLHCSPIANGFRIADIRDNDAIDLPWGLDGGIAQRVSVWDDEVDVLAAPVEVSAWFADKLGITCGLVFMPEAARRSVDPAYASGLTSLSDGFPYLIVSQASLDDLNSRMPEPLPMDRFRPNIVIAGGEPFQEDDWKEITIGNARFALVKPCARCAITTTDQRTGERGKEPLRTLATYRRRKGSEGEVKVDFGMNAMALGRGSIVFGDLVIGMIHSILADKATRLYLVLGSFFVANALVAEMIGVKLFQLETALGLSKADFSLLGQHHLSFVLSVGVLPWPIVFIMTDVINDYYGVRGVRFLTLLTTGLIAFAFIVMYAAIHMPPDLGWWMTSSAQQGVPDMQAAFVSIFGQGMNIILGSLTAFVIGQLVDAFIFRRIKRITGDKRIWLRATGSTVVSQLIDSVVVTYVAFWIFKGMPFPLATALVLTAYSYKLLVAVLATPFVYLAHAGVERYLGKERAHTMREAAMRQADEQ